MQKVSAIFNIGVLLDARVLYVDNIYQSFNLKHIMFLAQAGLRRIFVPSSLMMQHCYGTGSNGDESGSAHRGLDSAAMLREIHFKVEEALEKLLPEALHAHYEVVNMFAWGEN